MKVKELIELLKTCPDDEEVVVFMKGKTVSPILDLSRDIYRPNTVNSGKLLEYEYNRKDGDLDVVTLWSANSDD